MQKRKHSIDVIIYLNAYIRRFTQKMLDCLQVYLTLYNSFMTNLRKIACRKIEF